MYYDDKIASLRDVFGCENVVLETNNLRVGGKYYPIIDDVIVLLDPEQHPAGLRSRLVNAGIRASGPIGGFAEDIQYTFGEEWKTYNQVLPEHEREFKEYFDLVDLTTLTDARVCDLGCGIGRWAFFLHGRVREMVLVDFSEAIFEARRNLSNADNVLFFMGDLKRLPFRADFADFLYCLGVLHHLPTPALQEGRALARYAPRLLIYLYYSLDNRGVHFRAMLAGATLIRQILARVRGAMARAMLTELLMWLLYLPLILIGHLFAPTGLGRFVPLYEGYRGKTLARIRQDVYDRFFTRIEQRFSRQQIRELRDTFSEITISGGIPYWHFLCRR